MKTSTIALSVLLVAAVGYAGYLQTEVNRLKALPTRPAAVSDLAKAREERPGDGEESQRPDRRARVEADGDVLAEDAPPPAPPPDRDARRLERMKLMMAPFEDPALRADLVERQMNRIDDRYAAFFKTLGLNSDQMETLRTLMAEKEVSDREMRMRSGGAQSDEERVELDIARKQQQAAIDGQIAALLGESKASAMQDYTETLPYREEVQAFATGLSFTDSPLSEAQSNALASSIRDVSTNFEYSVDLSRNRGDLSKVSPEDIATYLSERAERDELLLQAAAETLNDSQLAAYAERQLAERERNERQLEFIQQNPQLGGRFGGGGGGGDRNRGGPRGQRP